MPPRYALRMELADSTLEEAFHRVRRKDWAIAAARRIAANRIDRNVVRVWVDDTTTQLGIASFEVCHDLDADND